ncbi:MAG: tRNA epoxyqueuosine(34) reductase QueG [Thermoanaerobaculales bacterium]
MHELTRQLKERARAEGFDLVGAATGASETIQHLRRWLEAGMHGEMAYLERNFDLRLDPTRLLPGCRSIVAVAMSYRTSKPDSTTPSGETDRVWVSRYAWGRDYHRILKKALIRLGRWLEGRRPGSTWRACVDTAPVLEREWAARAGLGWIGKNTSLLNRELGSELFLGVLLTDIELAEDSPQPEHCGSCTACLDACPTGAFTAPRELDARKCIAYLTVEHRSEVAEPLRRKLGAMIAGCDICQEVCPWTRRAPADLHWEFSPAPHRYRPRLGDLEELDEEGFREWRLGSPLNRISYAQFRRNLANVRANR